MNLFETLVQTLTNFQPLISDFVKISETRSIFSFRAHLPNFLAFSKCIEKNKKLTGSGSLILA